MTFSPEVLFLAAGMFLIAALVLTMVALKQRHEINQLRKPKYGFLGKHLYSVVTIAVLLGGFGFTLYGLRFNQSPDTAKADIKVDISIVYTIINPKSNMGKQIKFNAIPRVNGTDWGNSNEQVTVAWRVTNKVTNQIYIYNEQKLTKQTPGGYVVDLPSGQYTVSALVIYANKNWMSSIDLSI